jgi:hypothetical protein
MGIYGYVSDRQRAFIGGTQQLVMLLPLVLEMVLEDKRQAFLVNL